MTTRMRIIGSMWTAFCLACAGCASSSAPDPSAAASPAMTPAAPAAGERVDLVWSEMGPYRAGRVTTVAGVPGDPLRFYMGATGGGVWRTDNAGSDWRQLGVGVFDTGSVGVIALAPSDPDTIYVGMGESPYRIYSSSYGDGLYRSDDAGETWRTLGFDDARQIGAIVIDPRHPDVVWVAVQGSPWGASERGVYKSTNGGATFERTLFVGETAGAVDLAMDPSNHAILYATIWDHDYDPWYLGSGGPLSGVFKSTDRGETWRRIEEGLPAGGMGKVGVAPASGDPGRVWLLIEAEPGQAGLYRSDDYGESWSFVNGAGEIRTRPWYYTHVFADPHDPDTLYSFGQDAHRSTDAGATFEQWFVAGYDYHALWISPDDPDVVIVGSDGGAAITVDGGTYWSSVHNQPTAQLYRIGVDAATPYRLYAGQQDNSTVSLPTRPNWGGFDGGTFVAVGGGETGYVEPDPFDPYVVYATTELGTLTRYDRRTNAELTIHAPLIFAEGVEPRELRYRFAVNGPVLPSKSRRCVVYHGAQVLLRSTDCGETWEEASGDLTFDDENRQGAGGGPYTNEIINHFGAIASIAESPIDPDVLWTGANDGAVGVTRDGGASWSVIEPGLLPEGSVNTIEASPHDVGTAYAAVFGMPWNDYSPHVYRTTDYGASWTDISAGLPDDAPVRVVREDPKTPGLLFVGTERAVHYSRDGGTTWRSLRLNMPGVPVTDMKFAGDDLVISTMGRGAWVLFDIAPLRAVDPYAPLAEPLLLVSPEAYRVVTNGQQHPESEADIARFNPTNFGEPLPTGAVIDVLLPQGFDPAGSTLEVVDASGAVVRRLFTDDDAETLTIGPGHTRMIWNLREDALADIPGAWDSRGLVPSAPVGDYTVRLQTGGRTLTAPVSVVVDPRLTEAGVTARDVAFQDRIVAGVVDLLGDIVAVGQEVEARRACLAADDPQAQSVAAIGAWQNEVADPRLTINNDRVNFGASLIYDVRTLLSYAQESSPPLSPSYTGRLEELRGEWATWKEQGQALLDENPCV